MSLTEEYVEVADELKELSNKLVLLAKKVCDLGTPHQGDTAIIKKRAKTPNILQQGVSNRNQWDFRGVSKEIYCTDYHLSNGEIHLSSLRRRGLPQNFRLSKIVSKIRYIQ